MSYNHIDCGEIVALTRLFYYAHSKPPSYHVAQAACPRDVCFCAVGPEGGFSLSKRPRDLVRDRASVQSSADVNEQDEQQDEKQNEIEQPVVAIRKPTQLHPRQPARNKKVVRVAENYWDLVGDYESRKRSRNRSDDTLATYGRTLADFAAFLERENVSLHIEAIGRMHVERYIVDIMTTRKCKAGTAKTRFDGLHAFFNWCVDEGELEVSPMAKIHSPHVPKEPPEIITDDQLERLLRACRGNDFYSRRDRAMIRMLIDTGLRRGGLCSMRHEDLDMKDRRVRVRSKRKTWDVTFYHNTEDALRTYLRERRRHEHADVPELWLSNYGALNPRSLNGIIEKRAVQAGIRHINPHLFRHTWAHVSLAEGMQEGDVTKLDRWANAGMIHSVYGASAAHERTIAAANAKRLGDRV